MLIFVCKFTEKLSVLDPRGWIKANVRANGYYIVNYDKENWIKLIKQLKNYHVVSCHLSLCFYICLNMLSCIYVILYICYPLYMLSSIYVILYIVILYICYPVYMLSSIYVILSICYPLYMLSSIHVYGFLYLHSSMALKKYQVVRYPIRFSIHVKVVVYWLH